MSYHIIAILGLAGKNRDGSLTKSTYSKDSDISELKNGEFINSTHCLMESFGESATYTFLGTSDSIAFQQNIFANLSQCKAIFDKNSPKVLSDNEIQRVFSEILSSIKEAKEDNIILDITHGFRHQPIIASFASTLGQINTKKSITLLFAKEIEQGKKYQYISLEKYSQISLIALSLQTFVQTLSVPNMGLKEPFIIALSEFSKSLHANDFNHIFANLDKTSNELQKAKNNAEFGGLENILYEVEKILSDFVDIKNTKKDYQKHYKIAKIMHEKGYYLIVATYIYEAIALYIIDDLSGQNLICKRGFSEYELTNAVRFYVLADIKPNDTKNGKNVFADFTEIQTYRKNNQTKFESWKNLIGQIKTFRNDLAHISKDKKYDTKMIGGELKGVLSNLGQIISQNPHKQTVATKPIAEGKLQDGLKNLNKIKNL
ncbi:TM1812 family CRISPR-associated protein [Helicobacter sp. MIT 01-3238]|uniref:TM1812 family CRISPR-associated protein n=1 Tax=Helicobacter sp. MIT 01-3238 TaxID=398627 RepID=UPI000E1E9C3B|nr:TM1812 family CRISPR-associated protein [Helicobacter sp. MIT 01-3238]RDU54277.1 hypothetical protein CQA40_03580 [Helicobacter sp. MIT 01-3238]